LGRSCVRYAGSFSTCTRRLWSASLATTRVVARLRCSGEWAAAFPLRPLSLGPTWLAGRGRLGGGRSEQPYCDRRQRGRQCRRHCWYGFGPVRVFCGGYLSDLVGYLLYSLMDCVAGYDLGGSTVAMFGRVGGGIPAKAAVVGADLVGRSRPAWRRTIRTTLLRSPTTWATMSATLLVWAWTRSGLLRSLPVRPC